MSARILIRPSAWQELDDQADYLVPFPVQKFRVASGLCQRLCISWAAAA